MSADLKNNKAAEEIAKEKQVLSLSSNPEKAVREMMETITALEEVYKIENAALEKADTATFLSLQESKLAAARLYQDRAREIMDRKNEMENVDPTLKNKLAGMQTGFTALAKTNAELLERMRNSMDRVGNILRRAAKQTAREQQTYHYDARGSIAHGENKSVSTGINETA